jgi:branched-chain amino acid transport system ATP-binding protein
MLAIARGLMAQPRYLVLDEPSLGLSPILVVEIFRMIEKLRARGIAILLSEQNARMSLAIADRAYVIETGRVVIEGGGRELLARPEVAERYLGVGKGVGALDDERRLRLTAGLRNIFGARSD